MATAELGRREEGNIIFDGYDSSEQCPLDPPAALWDRLAQYENCRQCAPEGWIADGGDGVTGERHALIVGTRFGDTRQLHRVNHPGGARHQLTFFDEPVPGCWIRPSCDGVSGFAFMRDTGGAEAYQVYFYNMASGVTHLLSDGESKNGSVRWSRDGMSLTFFSTERNGKDLDVMEVNCSSADVSQWQSTRHAIFEGEGANHPIDHHPDGVHILMKLYRSINESYLFILNKRTGERTPFEVTSGDEDRDAQVGIGSAVFAPERISSAVREKTNDKSNAPVVLFTSDVSGEFRTLYAKSAESGSERLNVSGSVAWDVREVEVSHASSEVCVVANEDGTHRLYRLCPGSLCLRKLKVKGDLPSSGLFLALSFDPAGERLALAVNCATHPSDTYVIEIASGEMKRWTYSEVGGLSTSKFVAPSLIRYPTFDESEPGVAREIPAFWYCPSDATEDNKAAVIVYIHGGPESQFIPSFIPSFQYYVTEMGISIIAPNVRGSSGYGKSYLLLDNQRKREDSVKDIGSLLDWVEQNPKLDSSRIIVNGGSYGGYMVLACMIHYGNRLMAGMERVGISNFVTFLENTKPYRRELRREEYGDESDPDMREFLQSISPLTRASEIRKPMLIAQGLNDPRVPAGESEQIVQAVRANGVLVWYMLAKDEGHGFKKKVNKDKYRIAEAMFLRKQLNR